MTLPDSAVGSVPLPLPLLLYLSVSATGSVIRMKTKRDLIDQQRPPRLCTVRTVLGYIQIQMSLPYIIYVAS